jgi:hypothetical protein
MRRTQLVFAFGLIACRPGRQNAAGGTSTETSSSESTAASTESGGHETETDSEETETDSEETETETSSEESETETSNEEEVCEFGCEGAVEVAEGIVECPDGRTNRIGGGTFDPTITAPSCVGDEDILECTSDAQCNSGMNGRCIQEMTYVEGDSGDGDGDPGTICRCAYSCSSDDDCEQGSVCLPPEVLHPQAWPVCRPALCETGSDCGECGECGMTALGGYCPGSEAEYIAHCRTEGDTCISGCELGACIPQPNRGWHCEYQRECF